MFTFPANNSIQARGAKFIADALKVNRSLTALYLGISTCNITADNELQAEGAKHLTEALVANATLTLLDISTTIPEPQCRSERAESCRGRADSRATETKQQTRQPQSVYVF